MQIKINSSIILYLNICTAIVSMSLLCNAMCYKRNSFFGFKFPDSIDHPLKTISLGYQNLLEIHIRRGGSSQMVNHSEWLDTIDSEGRNSGMATIVNHMCIDTQNLSCVPQMPPTEHTT
jgi:hypothetical protein